MKYLSNSANNEIHNISDNKWSSWKEISIGGVVSPVRNELNRLYIVFGLQGGNGRLALIIIIAEQIMGIRIYFSTIQHFNILD